MGSFGGCLKETPVGVRFNLTTLTLVTFGVSHIDIPFGYAKVYCRTFDTSHFYFCQCNWHDPCIRSICRIGLMSSHAKLSVSPLDCAGKFGMAFAGPKIAGQTFHGFYEG